MFSSCLSQANHSVILEVTHKPLPREPACGSCQNLTSCFFEASTEVEPLMCLSRICVSVYIYEYIFIYINICVHINIKSHFNKIHIPLSLPSSFSSFAIVNMNMETTIPSTRPYLNSPVAASLTSFSTTVPLFCCTGIQFGPFAVP